MLYDKSYFECKNRFVKFQRFSAEILKPIINNPKFALLYTINKHWKEIIGERFFNYTEIEKATLLNENKNANLYIKSYNSAVSFEINNNKTYILEKINNLFGYKAILNLYIQEIPKRIYIEPEKKYTVNQEKLQKYENIIADSPDNNLKNKLIELAQEFFKEEIK